VDLQETLDEVWSRQATGHQREAEEALAEAAEAATEPSDCQRIADTAEECAERAHMLHRRRFKKIAERARDRAEVLEGIATS
jgi:hypothetical protein